MIIDHWGIVKADIGLKDGRIFAIGKAGNPDVQPGVNIIIGPSTEAIAGEGMIVTAGGVDTHIHFICPQQIDEALVSGITTMIGGGTGPATGTNATTCTPGPWHIARMLESAEGLPMNLGFLGIGGPVGSGKTTLTEMLCKAMRARYDLVVVTNDIYTKEDQRLLTVAGALAPERIMGVETGGCPHTAIREDASINLDAVDQMLGKFPDADIVFIESGGDNLAATFSPELSDHTIYVIDVAGGEKIPRKGGPGITRSDLLLINKIDLAPHVGADLEVMKVDAKKQRGDRLFVMTNLKSQEGLLEVIEYIREKGLFEDIKSRPWRPA